MPPPKGILELDRFSNADLARWQNLSTDLDELNASLYFGTEPARRRLRSKLCDALTQAGGKPVDLQNWARTVTYQYSLQPLSCAGSLQSVGGRFNAGFELDDNTLNPWPALYMAEDFETAYREKFQLASTDLSSDLSHIDLVGPAPSAETITRLDSDTSPLLEGWDSIPRNRRNIQV